MHGQREIRLVARRPAAGQPAGRHRDCRRQRGKHDNQQALIDGQAPDPARVAIARPWGRHCPGRRAGVSARSPGGCRGGALDLLLTDADTAMLRG